MVRFLFVVEVICAHDIGHCVVGDALDAYIAKLGWPQENGVVSVPVNPDNQIQASVVRENIQFNRMPSRCRALHSADPLGRTPKTHLARLQRVTDGCA